MNRKLKKLITSLMMVWVMSVIAPLGQITSWADNTRIAFSDPSVMVGNQVTATMKVTSDNALGTATIMLSYDPNMLKFVSGSNANGGEGTIKVLGTMDSNDQKTFRFTLKFKALQAGSTKINVTSQEVYDVDGKTLTVGKVGNSSVKVTSPATYSKDATLKSLKISPGTLNPEFSSSVHSYTAQVDGNTKDMVVNAVASNAGAKVTLSGEKGLKNGENKVVVKVTAEDREAVQDYTILVTKADGEAVPAIGENGENSSVVLGDVKVTILDKEYNVAKSFDESTLPEGFEAEKYQFKDKEIMAGKSTKKNLLLIYLQGPDGKGGFYIYNEGADDWSPYIQLENNSINSIVIIPLDKDTAVPEDFVVNQVTINDMQVKGWKLKTEAKTEYCLFYAMNGNGEKHFYRYDIAEKTIQRYFASGVSSETYKGLCKTYDSLVNDYKKQFYILIAVSILALILLVVVIVLVRKGSSSKSQNSFRDDYGRGRSKGADIDSYYDDQEEEVSSGRVRRYSREEYDNDYSGVQIDPEYFEDEIDRQNYEEDDDFIEGSLDDMEGNPHANYAQPPSEENDDFEFIDLDD